MPPAQVMIARFNEYLANASFIRALRDDPGGLRELADTWKPTGDPDAVWRDFARQRLAARAGLHPAEITDEQLDADGGVQIMAAMPSGLKAALQAIVHENFQRGVNGRGPTVPITMAWVPGYDYGLQVWDITDSATSMGGITILLTTRYPTDTHPLTGFALSS